MKCWRILRISWENSVKNNILRISWENSVKNNMMRQVTQSAEQFVDITMFKPVQYKGSK